MASKYQRDWAINPRIRAALVKCWSLVRGTEYEKILNEIKLEGENDAE